MSVVQRLVQQKQADLDAQLQVCKKKSELLESMRTMSTIELELELFDMLDVHSEGRLRLGEVMEVLAGCGDLVEALEPQDLAGLETQAAGGEGLDRAQFGHFIEALVSKAGGDFKDWAQLLVLSHPWPAHDLPSVATSPLPDSGRPRSPAIKDAVKTAAADGRMRELFTLFDADLDGRLNFSETVVGLRKVAPAVPLEAAEEAALRVLLSYDVEHDRHLDYHEFVHFITCFLASAELSFGQVADALVLAAARPDPSDEEAAALGAVQEEEQWQTFSDVRCHRLFDMTDKDSDGRLAFKDLVMLFHKFQPIKPVQALAHELLAIIRQHPGLAQEQQGAGTGGGAGAAAGGEHDSDYVMVGQDSGSGAAAGAQQQGSTGVGPAMCRSQFAFLLGRFVKACGAGSFGAVADHLLTVAATAPIDQCAACRPGWWFNSVANGVNPEDGRSGFRQAGEGGPLVQELSQGGVGQKRKASEGDEVSSSSMVVEHAAEQGVGC